MSRYKLAAAGYLCRTMGSFIVPVLVVLDPGLSTVQIFNAYRILAP